MMKKFLTSIIIITTVFVGCQPKACEDVNCNNGTCEKGECICEAGYEGPNCQTEQRQAFVAIYNVEESCNPGNLSYIITVSANSANASEITINNMGDFNFDVIATVSGATLSIDYETGNGARVVGNGTLENGVLTISYTMTTSSNQVLNCDMVCTPQ